MTWKRKLLQGVLFLLIGAGIGSAILHFAGVPLRIRPRGKTCSDCPMPPATPELEADEGHKKLGAPEPGEWRARFREAPQSFEQFRAENLNRTCVHRTTFYLQPLGDAGTRYRETLERMRRYAEAYFGIPAKVLDPIPLFEDALAADRDQYDADRVIGGLAERLPDDALVYMGITEKDLYVRGLNFVFGVGDRNVRCGIYSLTRFETEDATLFTRRSLNLLAHEAGHIVSINHCVTYSCVMQGANSLPEHDRHPMHLCPIDLQKVLWNGGLDRSDRYRALLPLYREWGLTAEALWVTARLGR